MAERWSVTWTGEDVHVFPLADLVGHELSADCACGPQPEEVEPGAWMYSHASLDGRELQEAK